LLLRVVDFSLTALNCMHDYLAVHTFRKMEKFCGEYPMGTFYRTRESQLSLEFFTKLSARGFWIEYKARSSKSLLTLSCASLSAPSEAPLTSTPTWRSDASAPVDRSSSPLFSSTHNSSSSSLPFENSSLKQWTRADEEAERKSRKPTKSRSCPYWEVGCSASDTALNGLTQNPASEASGAISTVFIILVVVAILVFLSFIGVFVRRKQQTLVANGQEETPSEAADNGGLGSFYRGAKLSLDSINSSSEWNGAKNGAAFSSPAPLPANGVIDVKPSAVARDEVTDAGMLAPPTLSQQSHHLSASSQSLEEWGRMDEFGLQVEQNPDGRKSGFYRSRSFTMLDAVGQVSPYVAMPDIEISNGDPDSLLQIGVMPTLASLHYGDYGVLAVSPYQPAGSPFPPAGSIDPSPVTLLTASPVLTLDHVSPHSSLSPDDFKS